MLREFCAINCSLHWCQPPGQTGAWYLLFTQMQTTSTVLAGRLAATAANLAKSISPGMSAKKITDFSVNLWTNISRLWFEGCQKQTGRTQNDHQSKNTDHSVSRSVLANCFTFVIFSLPLFSSHCQNEHRYFGKQSPVAVSHFNENRSLTWELAAVEVNL